MGMWTIPKGRSFEETFSDEQMSAFIETTATALVRRRLTVPAIMALEMAKPLSFLGYSAMAAFAPVLNAVVPPHQIALMTGLCQDRTRIERLIRAIETKAQTSPETKEETREN